MGSRPSLEVYSAAERARLEQDNALSDLEELTTNEHNPTNILSKHETKPEAGGNPPGLEEVGRQCTLPLLSLRLL